MVDEVVETVADVMVGNDSIISSSILNEGINSIEGTTDSLLVPLEILGVFFYVVLVITYLLPCLLCCSKKYSYKRL